MSTKKENKIVRDYLKVNIECSGIPISFYYVSFLESDEGLIFIKVEDIWIVCGGEHWQKIMSAYNNGMLNLFTIRKLACLSWGSNFSINSFLIQAIAKELEK